MSLVLRPDRLAVAAPVILLLGMVAMHGWLVHEHHLSPWLGAGFGMFSSYDGPSNRTLQVYAHGGGLEWPVEIPDGPQTLAYRVAAMPSPGRLEAFALELINDPDLGLQEIEGLRIEVWRRTLTGRPTTAAVELLQIHRHDLE